MAGFKVDTKAQNFPDAVPDGEYIFEITGASKGIQVSKGVTNGSANRDLKLRLFDEELNAVGQINRERLILHESIWWKVNTFLVSASYQKNGRPLTDNDEINPDVDLQEADLLGLRGWCVVKNKPGEKKPELKFSYVDRWLTDRDKLPRANAKPQPKDEWDKP